jgi:hypothetical protein
MSVRQRNKVPAGRILNKFHIWVFFENLSRKFKYSWNLTRITRTLHEDQCTFVVISRPVLLRVRNVSDKSCRENQSTHFSPVFFFQKSSRLWDNVEKYRTAGQATDDNMVRRMRFAWWVTKVTNTHSQYVILIAFPRQQWLRERVSLLLYVHLTSSAVLCWHNHTYLISGHFLLFSVPVVTLCTSILNIQTLCILPTEYISLISMDHKTNSTL